MAMFSTLNIYLKIKSPEYEYGVILYASVHFWMYESCVAYHIEW